MKKTVKLKLNMYAGKATSNPPIGSILSQYGINISYFCKEYNRKTESFKGLEIPVSIIIFDVKNILIKLYLPSISFLIIYFSSNNTLNINDLKKILKIKKKEYYSISIIKYIYTIKGTLKSMKIKIQK